LSALPKRVKTEVHEYLAKSVILTTGLRQRRLNLPGEGRLTGKGVSYCSTCDGNFFRGKKVIVLGSGNDAARDLLYLSPLASNLLWLCNSRTVMANEALVKRLEEKGIRPDTEATAVEVIGDEIVTGLRVRNSQGGEEIISANGIFIATGTAPATELEKAAGIAVDDKGFIRISAEMETNVSGVFAAGDCTGKSHQIIVAVGQGATAGIMASAYAKGH
jgi:thioredoxin reductase (NADPH)